MALDIDGTLLRWVDGGGAAHEEMSEAVREAVQAARDGGAHIVLSSGRSPHSMTDVADQLGLGSQDEPVWVVASNGAVVFRYPPLDVVLEETFDARAAVAAVLAEHPDAIVAVEERGWATGSTSPSPRASSPGR